MKKTYSILILSLLISTVSLGQSKEEKELTNLLNEFLEKVDSKEMHDRFWGEDLTYTSSSGTRNGKESIMAGFANDDDTSDTSGPTYWAEDIEIKVFGELAVVAFKLMSKSPDGSNASYLNSGTFVKRKGNWKVVNWQATKTAEK